MNRGIKILVALFGGVLTCGLLSVCLYGLVLATSDNPTIYLFWLNFAYLLSLPYIFLNSFLEEGFKLLFLKWSKLSSGILFGLSYGITEIIIRNWSFGNPLIQFIPLKDFSFILHILTASILVYSIKKKKAVWGFLIAILIHTLWNYKIMLFQLGLAL